MFFIIDQKKTGENLRKLMEEREMSAKDVQRYLGLSNVQSVNRWLNGSGLPSVAYLYLLSKLFEVSMDDIVCGGREETVE